MSPLLQKPRLSVVLPNSSRSSDGRTQAGLRRKRSSTVCVRIADCWHPRFECGTKWVSGHHTSSTSTSRPNSRKRDRMMNASTAVASLLCLASLACGCSRLTPQLKDCFELKEYKFSKSNGECDLNGYLVSSDFHRYVSRSNDLAEISETRCRECLVLSDFEFERNWRFEDREDCVPSRIGGTVRFVLTPERTVIIKSIAPEISRELKICRYHYPAAE